MNYIYIRMMENDNTLLSISRAVTAIKTAILQSQARTIRNANSDVLALYYAVGQYISTESRTQKWGSGAIKTISKQLRKELPGLRDLASPISRICDNSTKHGLIVCFASHWLAK